MSTADFLDSNVLLYLPTSDRAKAAKVSELLASGGTISVQVLDEFAAVARRKFGRTMPEIRLALGALRAVCTIQPTDVVTHERGLDIAERYRFSVYDSMLIAAALEAGCTTFYSEDLQHGQRVEGMSVVNPFAS